MSDLEKLMKKLGDNKKPAEKPAEKPTQAPVKQPTQAPVKQPTQAPVEKTINDDDDDDDEEGEVATPSPQEVEEVSAIQQQEETSIMHEVALLQNDGVFRRELLMVLKEFVDVHKVNTQTIIEIKKKLLGEEDAPKED